jgi:prepilin signal peptidase PulO-like enzyme (type II secretory pathway)
MNGYFMLVTTIVSILFAFLLSQIASFLLRKHFNHSVDEWHDSTLEVIKQKDLLDVNEFNAKKFSPLKNLFSLKGFSLKEKIHQSIMDLFCCIFIAWGFIALNQTLTIPFFIFVLLTLLLATHILTDFHQHLLLDETSYIILWGGLLIHLFPNYELIPMALSTAVTSAFIGYMAFYLFSWLFKVIRGVDGLGLGDAKLIAAFGAWIGLKGLLSVILTGSLLGLIGIVIFKKINKKNKNSEENENQEFPFGPALCVSFMTILVLMMSHLPYSLI